MKITKTKIHDVLIEHKVYDGDSGTNNLCHPDRRQGSFGPCWEQTAIKP